MPTIDKSKCVACGVCIVECAEHAICGYKTGYEIDQDDCVQCGDCIDVCPMDAIVKTPLDNLKDP